MTGRSVRLLGLSVLALLLGCRPDASEEPGDLALASAALGTQPQPTQQAPQSQLVLRRLWEGPNPDFWAADVSPDGQLVSQSDWDTGDLAVIDLASGELRRVTDKASRNGTWDFAESSVFSPDGQRLAFAYWNEDRDVWEIRMTGVDGSGQRTIVPDAGDEPELMDWSGDGLYLLALLWVDDPSPSAMCLGLVSVGDGSVRSLKEFGAWHARSSVGAFSPDGRLVAYDLGSSQQAEHDIYVLPVDGGREVALLTGPEDDRLLGWTPDGSGILFYSDRGLTKGIWSLRVSDGKPVGEPALLRGDVWGLEPIGFSRNAYYYGVTTQERQVNTAIIDPQAWRLVTAPAPIEDPSAGGSWCGTWSPDGRQLAYQRLGGLDAKFVIRSVDEEGSREITVPQVNAMGLQRWTDDGRALLMVGRDSSTATGVFRVDLDTGAATNIWQVDEGVQPHPRAAQFSSDLKTAYFTRIHGEWTPTKPHTIVARDLASGREREIATVRFAQALALSPDGQTLAFADYESAESSSSRIATVPISGGEIREVYRGTRPGGVLMPTTLSWSSDGRYLLFADLDEQANRYSIWRVPAGGGERDRMELPFGNPPGLRMLSFHPDGTRIAFESGESRGEIWVVENLPGTR
jgi:Tol biopolymer transport system component